MIRECQSKSKIMLAYADINIVYNGLIKDMVRNVGSSTLLTALFGEGKSTVILKEMEDYIREPAKRY